MKMRPGLTAIAVGAGVALAAGATTGAGAANLSTYSITDVQRTSVLTVNGVEGRLQHNTRVATTYRFTGRRGKNKVSIDFRNKRKAVIVADGLQSNAPGKLTATVNASYGVSVIDSANPPATCAFRGTVPKDQVFWNVLFEGPARVRGPRVKFGMFGPDALDVGAQRLGRELAPDQTGCNNFAFSFSGPRETGYSGRRMEKPGWRSLEIPQKKLRRTFKKRPQKVVVRGVKRTPVFAALDDPRRIGTQTTRTRVTMWLVSNKPSGRVRGGVVIRT